MRKQRWVPPSLSILQNHELFVWATIFFFFNTFYWLYYYSCPISCPLLYSPPSCKPFPSTFPHLSSHPRVMHINSLASTFTILFLPSPCLFFYLPLCYLFSVPFPPFSSLSLPTDNSPCDLLFCDSVPVLVVCLVCFCFCFRCGCY